MSTAVEARSNEAVAYQVRETLKASSERFWRPSELGPADFQDAVHHELSDIILNQAAEQIDLIRIRKGLYWKGTSKPEILQIAMEIAEYKEGLGYAGASAAYFLGLTEEKPEIEEVGFAKRPPRPIPDLPAKWISRAGRLGRIIEGLNGAEVALLEVMAEPSLITINIEESMATISKLLRDEQVSATSLTKAAKAGEPALAREGLRNLFLALGKADLASEIPPAHSKSVAVRERAFRPAAAGS